MLAAKNHPVNCGLATSTFTRTFTKRGIAARSFDIVATSVQRVTAAAGETIVNVDKTGGTTGTALKTVLRKSGATYVTDYAISINKLIDGYFQSVSVVSESPAVLSTPGTNGIAAHQADGDCVFRATALDGESAAVKLTASTTYPATVDKFQSWATGSLARHCTDQINSLIATKTQLNVFNQTSWFTPPDFVRNSNCWANGIDLSCVSPWNNEAGALYAGTLISPRHVAFCRHASFYPQNGKTITFVSTTSTPVTRTITNSVNVENADIRIALLDSDVPSTIKFAKILPTNWATYLPGLNRESYVPVMCFNQTERASISGLYGLNLYFDNTYPSAHAAYYGDIILYDSGNPTFLVVNGELVLLGVFSTGGAGSGAHIAYHTTAVNAAMTALGGGYQTTAVSLSAFSTY